MPKLSTWDGLHIAPGVILSNANRRATNVAASGGVCGNIAKTAGKWYFEITQEAASASAAGIGIIRDVDSLTSVNMYTAMVNSQSSPNVYLYYWDGTKWNGSSASYGTAYTDGVVGIALDLETGQVWAALNNTWQNGGNPVAGTGAMFTGLSGSIRPFALLRVYSSTTQGSLISSNAAQCTYTPPSGFSYLETLVTIGNNAKTSEGAAIDLVIITDSDTDVVVATVEPATNGDWSANIPEGNYLITYYASGGYPVTHGPYAVSA